MATKKIDLDLHTVSAETRLLHDFGRPNAGVEEVLWTCAVSSPEIGLVAVSRANMNIAVYRHCSDFFDPPSRAPSAAAAAGTRGKASYGGSSSSSSSTYVPSTPSGVNTATASAAGASTSSSSTSGSSTLQRPSATATRGGFAFYCSVDLSQECARTIRSLDFSPAPTGKGGILLACASFDAITLILHHNPNGEPLKNVAGSAKVKHEDVELVSSTPLDVPPWAVYQRFVGHDNEVKCVRFSPFGSFCATSGRDKAVYLYAMDSFDCIAVFTEHTGDVKYLAWRPNREDELLSCSFDSTIRVYRAMNAKNAPEEWSLHMTLDNHSNIVWSLAYSPDGSHFASCSQDKTVRVWREVKGLEDYELLKDRKKTAQSDRMDDVERIATDLLLLNGDSGPFTGIAQVTGGNISTAAAHASASLSSGSRTRSASTASSSGRTGNASSSASNAATAKGTSANAGAGTSSQQGGASGSSPGKRAGSTTWRSRIPLFGRFFSRNHAGGSAGADAGTEHEQIASQHDKSSLHDRYWVEDFAIDKVHEHYVYSICWARLPDGVGNDVLFTGCGDNTLRTFLLNTAGDSFSTKATNRKTKLKFRYAQKTQLDNEGRWLLYFSRSGKRHLFFHNPSFPFRFRPTFIFIYLRAYQNVDLRLNFSFSHSHQVDGPGQQTCRTGANRATYNHSARQQEEIPSTSPKQEAQQ
ncbi:unnamed protein product [Amoebophrya sp. A120]|nr:unnamed protein product [Amoebophrya sp. A120]|eukprot:GSA120T00006716001.1